MAKKEDDVKRWSAKVFCLNCLEVTDTLFPVGIPFEEMSCCICRVKGKLKFVRKGHGI
jgi:hypothetical protein